MPEYKVGEFYFWEHGFPHNLKDVKFRFVKILSVTLTHVYVKNSRTGGQRNIDIKTFKKQYSHVEQPSY